MSEESIFPKVLRRKDVFTVEDSCSIKIESKILIEITDKDKIFAYQTSKRLSFVEVKRSDGKPLFIATTKQMESNKSMDKIRNYLTNYRKIEDGEGNPIFIFLKRHDDNCQFIQDRWLEEITITWTEELVIENKSKFKKFCNNIKLQIPIKRKFGYYNDMQSATHYVELKTNEKYEIGKYKIVPIENNSTLKAKVIEKESDSKKYKLLSDDKRRYVFSFETKKRDNANAIEWMIKIPFIVRLWVYFGVSIGLFVIGLLVILIFNKMTPEKIIEGNLLVPIIGSVLIILIGLRLLIFHDIELMRAINIIYIILITLTVFLTVIYSIL